MSARPPTASISLSDAAFLVERVFRLYASPHSASRGRSPARSAVISAAATLPVTQSNLRWLCIASASCLKLFSPLVLTTAAEYDLGSAAALQAHDYLTCTYRGHHHSLARGMDPKRAIAEVLGKIDGFAKGKGGSMHMFDKANHFYGGHGIVGGQIPLGAGIAFAEKFKGKDNVCVVYMGDGAVRQYDERVQRYFRRSAAGADSGEYGASRSPYRTFV